MNDTTAKITDKMCEMIRLKSPEERLKMGCSMNKTSRFLITRAIFEQNPHISKKNLRHELFLKFYGDDFDLKTQRKILDQLI